MDHDSVYMARCLELAKNGASAVRPNPYVGAVVVHNDKIIAEAWHARFGGPHAEVVALNNLTDKSLLKDAVLYVSLEPCSHHGKTPPCTDLIISSGIKKVVCATLDPFPQVAGKGISLLENAGISVTTGVLHDEAIILNRRFMLAHRFQRPYVTLKWAQTEDGYVARTDYSSKWISCEDSRKLVHTWRADEQAILVGTRTALVDNPELTVRLVEGQNPIRVVIDKQLRLPHTLNIFDGSVRTLIITEKTTGYDSRFEYISTPFDNFFIRSCLAELYKKDITSLFVEGGAQTLRSFLSNDTWDEARVFIAPKKFGSGVKAPDIEGFQPIQKRVGVDTLLTYKHPQLKTRLGIS